MEKSPSRIIKYLAFCVDMLAAVLIIPWFINIYRFLHNKQTLGYAIFGLELKNKTAELSFKQTLIRLFTHLPFFIPFFVVFYIVFMSFMIVWKITDDEMLLSIVTFELTLLVILLFVFPFFSLISSFFSPTLSERWSKTKTVYKKE